MALNADGSRRINTVAMTQFAEESIKAELAAQEATIQQLREENRNLRVEAMNRRDDDRTIAFARHLDALLGDFDAGRWQPDA